MHERDAPTESQTERTSSATRKQSKQNRRGSTRKMNRDTSTSTQVGQVVQEWGSKLTEWLPVTRPRPRGKRSGPAPSREHIAALITALGDPQHPEHASSLESLVEIGSPSVPLLNDALGSQHSSWLTAYRAAEALGRIGDGRATSALIQALQHPNSNVRWSAVRALAQVGDLRALLELRRVAHEDHGRTSWGEPVAGAAQSALDQIQSQSIWSQSLELVKTAITSVLMILALILAFSVVTTLHSEIKNVGQGMPPTVLAGEPTVVPTEESSLPEGIGSNEGTSAQPLAPGAADEDTSAGAPQPASTPVPDAALSSVVTPTATATPEAAEPAEVTGKVLSGANIRPYPSVQNDPIGGVNQGDDIIFEGISPDGLWYNIRLGERYNDSSFIDDPAGGDSGWIHKELVSKPGETLPVLEPVEPAPSPSEAGTATSLTESSESDEPLAPSP